MFIVVLGGGIDLHGNLPDFVAQRLDKAIDLQQDNPGSKIVVSGKYSFLYNQLKQNPPTTEAEKMSTYLEKKGVPHDKILIEKESQDTISNAYFLKKNIFLPYQQTAAVVITTKFHLPRVKYIFQKIFGPQYQLEFIGTNQQLAPSEEKQLIHHQQNLLNQTKILLAPMADGNHHFMDGKFYTIDYYRQKRPDWVINFVAKGK